MTSSYSQDGSDRASTLSEGSTSLTVPMECSQEQGGCGIKRQNTTSLNTEAVPAHVESSVQELLQAINLVKTMADSLQDAIAPGMVSATLFCFQFYFLFAVKWCVTSCVCRSGLGMDPRSTKGFHRGAGKSPGHGNTSYLLHAQNILTQDSEPAELLLSLIACNKQQLVAHVGLSAQGCRCFTMRTKKGRERCKISADSPSTYSEFSSNKHFPPKLCSSRLPYP